MSRQKLYLVIAAFTVLATILSSCAAPAQPTPAPAAPAKVAAPTAPAAAAPAAKNTFIFGSQGEPVCLDPAIVTDGISAHVINQIYEGLVKFDGATTNVIPSLAEKWDTSADGKVWTFTLRKGVKFHDGTPFNAQAVVKNWDYWSNSANPQHKAQVDAGQTFEYYEAQFMGFDKDSIISKVEAKDDSTVVFTLKDPQGAFLNNLAMFVFVFWSPTALEKAGKDSCKNPVGTGPFKFVEWKADQYVRLAKNADYWDKDHLAKVDEAIIRNIKDNSARLNALKAGEVHVVEGLEPDTIKGLQGDKNFQVILRGANTTGFVSFNFQYKEFQNLKVRQAFENAINKKAIVDAYYGGTGVVAKELLPPALWGYNDKITDYPYDTAKAKSLLTEAGFPDGLKELTGADGKKVPLEFWYMPVSRPYFPTPKDIAEAISADLAKAGIQVQLKTVDWTVYLDKRKKGEMPLYMMGWTGDNGDPDNFLCYHFCKTGDAAKNEGFFPDTDVAKLLNDAAIKVKQDERAALYGQAEQLLHDRALRLFIANNQPPLAMSVKVKNYIANPTSTELFNIIELAQ
jgi:peptide/nickel transport system substrate-binding protein